MNMNRFYLLYTLIISVLYVVKSEKSFHYKNEYFDNGKANAPYGTHEHELNSQRLNNALSRNGVQETNSNHVDDGEEKADDRHANRGYRTSSILIIDIVDKIPAAKSSNFNVNTNLIEDNSSSNLLQSVRNKIRNSSDEESDEKPVKSSFSYEGRDSFDKPPAYSTINRTSNEETDERITKSYGQRKNATVRRPPYAVKNGNSYEETDEERTTKSPAAQRRDSFDKTPANSAANQNSHKQTDERIIKSNGEEKHTSATMPPTSFANRKPHVATDESKTKSYAQQKNSTATRATQSSNEENDGRITKPSYPSTVRIPPPSLMDSGKSNLRVCEIKYAEYIQRIFPQEFDTARDANDEEFNGRVLAAPGEYPHMSAVGFRYSDGKLDYKCGGSLISENFVITAAHCTNFTGLAPAKVRIGDLNLMVEESYLEPQIRDIKRIHVHPDYKTPSYYNDIALLELESEVRLTEFVRPIRLWTQETLPFRTAYAMGYGSTKFARERTNRLTDLNMTIVPNDECNQEMPKLPQTERGILPSQICARDYALNRDTCQGDSGGPLQLNIRGRRSQNRLHYQLIGITSYGLHCRSGYPSIFTRVCYYLDWIERIVWKNYFD